MKVTQILRAGASVFGASALLLIFLPGTFLELLGLESSEPLCWSMRMIGITVLALAGNMWQNSRQESQTNLRRVAQVMSACAMGLAILTLMAPTKLTWFCYLYALIGAGFSLAYLTALIRNKIR